MSNILILVAFLNGLTCSAIVPNTATHVNYAKDVAAIYNPESINLYETTIDSLGVFGENKRTTSQVFKIFDTNVEVQCQDALLGSTLKITNDR